MKIVLKKIKIYISILNPKFDPEYPRALAFVAKSGNLSISHLQRHFHFGFKRANRLMNAIKTEIGQTPRTINIKTKSWV